MRKPAAALPTPVRVHRLNHYLSGYTPYRRKSLVEGFTSGFHIPSMHVDGDVDKSYENHPSTLAHSSFVSRKLEEDIYFGRIAGPFTSPPHDNLVTSPLGVVPKKAPGEYRLIHDLSFPKNNSVNSHIDTIHTRVQYELLDHCISIIRSVGPNCLIAKADIKDAFRIIPIYPLDYRLLGFTWKGQFYHDKCLPMGCSNSCRIFESFATALQWILTSKFDVYGMSHILDDFIFFGPPNTSHCATGLHSFLALAESLNIPIRHDKTVLPTTITSLHGIEIDTGSMQMRLPRDKLLDARAKINSMYQRKKVTLREVQKLIGTLNFACKVVVGGRTFLRRVIYLTIGVRRPGHIIRLNVEARLDLSAWKVFLDQYSGVSLCLADTWLSSDCIKLFSDACLHGFAAVYGRRWVQGNFPANWDAVNIAVKELFPIVLSIQLWGYLMANSRILFMCDNMSIVSVINSHTSRDKHIMRLLRQLAVVTMTHNIHFASKHIPGKSNCVADALSRFQEDSARRIAPWLNVEADRVPPAMFPW